MLFKKRKVLKKVFSPISGEVKSIENSSDPVFSMKMMGDGVVIEPSDGVLLAPCDCKISMVYPTKHAIGLKLNNGISILIHFGIDTVSMNGKPFICYVKAGDKVKKGDLLLKADLDKIKAAEKSDEVLLVISENNSNIRYSFNYGFSNACEKSIIDFV